MVSFRDSWQRCFWCGAWGKCNPGFEPTVLIKSRTATSLLCVICVKAREPPHADYLHCTSDRCCLDYVSKTSWHSSFGLSVPILTWVFALIATHHGQDGAAVSVTSPVPTMHPLCTCCRQSKMYTAMSQQNSVWAAVSSEVRRLSCGGSK